MKTICVELSDRLAEKLGTLISQGWFQSEEDAVRFALMAFVTHQKPALLESFQRDDIARAPMPGTER